MNKITCGLFMYRGKYFWKNFRDIHILFKRIFFTLKHGYSPVARWETFAYFIDMMREILINYRHNRFGSPCVVEFNDYETWSEENEKAYDTILDKMIDLLDKMDENNEIYDNMDWKTEYETQTNAKNEFFKLFSEYFFSLWD